MNEFAVTHRTVLAQWLGRASIRPINDGVASAPMSNAAQEVRTSHFVLVDNYGKPLVEKQLLFPRKTVRREFNYRGSTTSVIFPGNNATA
jgi:hypothetical protein